MAHVRFGHELLDAAGTRTPSAGASRPRSGELTAQALVLGTGPLSAPSIPDLPGLERFEGTIFHSATWDHGHDLAGERVAVIGTGASAIQFVPQIQPRVGRLHLFQRTAPWIMPRPDRPLKGWERRLYRALPAAQLLMRAGIYWARESFVLGFRHPRVDAPGASASRCATCTARSATPSCGASSRRPTAWAASASSSPTTTCRRSRRENVEVVTDAIREVRPRSIVTADGTEREVDTIIFATGFHVTDMPAAERVRGRDGRSLAEVWDGSPQAHMGTTVAGCPNLFFLVGPNTGLGHNSIVFMIESQCNYVLDALRLMDARRRRRARGPRPRPRRPTTRASRSRCAARCGPRAAARAGTSTPRGATRRCGRPSPGPSARARAGSTRRTTSCARRGRRASPSPPDAPRGTRCIAIVTLM